MSFRARLLGFAFTNADFLFEVDAQGIIQFAAGAANDLVQVSGDTLLGKPASRLFKPSEATKFATFTKDDAAYRDPKLILDVANLQKNIRDLIEAGILSTTIEAKNYVDMSLAMEAAGRIDAPR